MTGQAGAAENSPDKRIWAIAGPAILANSSTPLVGLVDTWVIGHMPSAVHLAAVGVGAAIFSFIFWAVGFLRMSTTGLVAQAHGRGDIGLVARTVLRSASLGIVIALGILILQVWLFQAGLAALEPPESTKTLLADYFYIRIWSAPAVLFVYALNGYLIGTAQAKAALWLQLLLNITNGVLNLIFVLGLGMGVAGIALGSLIAEWVAAAFGLYLLLKGLGRTPLLEALRMAQTWQPSRMKKLLGTNSYIFVRTLILIVALSLITREAAKLGEVALAATQILNVFFLLISLGLDGFAFAAEALAGGAYGRGDIARFRFWVKRTMAWAGAAAVLYTLAFFMFGENLVSLLTSIVPVRLAANEALLIVAVMPVFSVWCYQFDGIFIGATAGRGMLVTVSAAFAVYLVALNYFTATMGLQGLWIAVVIFMLARGAAQALYYPLIERKIPNPE